MVRERFLVTGALGCIGAWTVRTLVRDGASVVGFDLGHDPRRLRSIMTPDEVARVELVAGDIADPVALTSVVEERRITNVIHLAALQVPFCKADPRLGAIVNVGGTVNVFEAVKRQSHAMAPVVYTSSIGMFSVDDADPDTGRLRADATPHPLNHYGVYKRANEGNARVYWLDDEIASVGLRPLTVYGVGRDQGMTSGPTKAIAAAVLGLPYRVPFGGPTLFQYAEDVARTLVAASRSGVRGAEVFNLDGSIADGAALVDAIAAHVPAARDLVSYEPVSLPFPPRIDHDGLEAVQPPGVTPFAEGVAQTIAIYRELAREDRLVPAEHGLESAAAAAAS